MLRARNPESCTLAAGRHSTEASCRLKFIQHCRRKLAFYEPALKIWHRKRKTWHRKRSFYNGVTLCLCHVPELPDRLAAETLHSSGLCALSLIIPLSRMHSPDSGCVKDDFSHPKPAPDFGELDGLRRITRAWILILSLRVAKFSPPCTVRAATPCTSFRRQGR